MSDSAGLTAFLGIEIVGIMLMMWGLWELYNGNNPVSGTVLIPAGSLALAVGSMLFAKVYDGPAVMG